jgi:hypothetical protein
MPRSFYLSVELVNLGDRPALVQVIDGAARPVVDTVLAGHRAGARYLRHALGDVGRVVEVPAGESRAILAQRVGPLQTASGVFGLRPLAGPALLAQVTAAPQPLSAVRKAGEAPTFALSQHVYPRPSRKVKAHYRVGGHWTFVSVGRQPIEGRHPERRLDGEYGVLYDIQFDLENPTAEGSTVNLVMAPDAGAARGAFLVEGQWIEVPNMVPPAEFVLGSVELGPEARGRLSVQTLPVGGSAYPVTLVLRPQRPGEPRHPRLALRGGADPVTETVEDEIPGN